MEEPGETTQADYKERDNKAMIPGQTDPICGFSENTMPDVEPGRRAARREGLHARECRRLRNVCQVGNASNIQEKCSHAQVMKAPST